MRQIEKSDESHESNPSRRDWWSDESGRWPDASCDTPRGESEESHVSGSIRRDASSDESNFVGATGGDPRVGRVDESNTQPPRRSLVSGPVGATRRTTAERVESTVEFCRSDKSTGRYDSKTRVGPRRVASGRAWTWLMSRRRRGRARFGCELSLSNISTNMRALLAGACTR